MYSTFVVCSVSSSQDERVINHLCANLFYRQNVLRHSWSTNFVIIYIIVLQYLLLLITIANVCHLLIAKTQKYVIYKRISIIIIIMKLYKKVSGTSLYKKNNNNKHPLFLLSSK